MKKRNNKGQFINQSAFINYSCKFCNKSFNDFRGNKRIFCSRLCQNTWLARNKNGFLGKIKQNASYSSIHKWLKRHFKKPLNCQNCGNFSNHIDWANINHSYSRNINDYKALCRSCHTKYDHGRIVLCA